MKVDFDETFFLMKMVLMKLVFTRSAPSCVSWRPPLFDPQEDHHFGVKYSLITVGVPDQTGSGPPAHEAP